MRSTPARLLPFALALLGCSPPEGGRAVNRADASRDAESLPPTEPPGTPPIVHPLAPPKRSFVASTDRGLALVVSGRIVAESPNGGLVQDVVVAGDRVLTFETDQDGENATIVERTLVGESFGPPTVHRGIDGHARLASTPSGVVLFESSYGDRWRMLSTHLGASFIAPMPSSAWWDGAHLTTLARDGHERYALHTVTTSASSITEDARVELPMLVHDTARATPQHVLDIVGGRIVLRRPDGALMRALELESDGLADALDVPDGVAMTSSGPRRLVVVRGASTGEPPRVLPLDRVYVDAELLTRTLVLLDEQHLAVATPTSVLVVRLGAELEVITHLEGVRAPIAGL